MSLETQLYTLLSGITPRVFPDFAPASTARPYVTFQIIGGQAINTLDRFIPNKRHADVQVDVWSDTRMGANTLMQSIEDAIRMSTVWQGEPVNAPHTSFDADVPVFGCIQDFSIWADR